MKQSQDSLHDQLIRVRTLAVQNGCYDAADFLTSHIEKVQSRRLVKTFSINFWARRPSAAPDSQRSEYFRKVAADDLDGAIRYLENFFMDISVISFKEIA